jgi:UDP-glucose 4-epimerase
MKILIIGSKGFIGSHLSKSLSSLPENEVFECDVVVDYEKTNYYLVDATNGDYQSIFLNNQFDLCINCSGAASVPDSLIHPLRDFTLNTYNVFKLLDSIRQHQKKCRFLNISSAAVYGNPTELPIAESQELKPISPYGIHKVQAETICSMFYNYYKIPTSSVRVFSAYGEGLKKQLFWDLIQKTKAEGPISMFGTGNESRDFIHIDDVVQAIRCVADQGEFQGDAINIANGEEITIKEAVDTLISLLPFPKTASFNGLVKAGDPLNWKSDISKLTSLGYKQSVNLQEGLRKYYSWISTL